jgi:uncharacterized membrane protein
MNSNWKKGRLMFAILLGVPAGLMFLFSIARPVMGNSGNFIDPVLSATCHRMPSRCVNLPWGTSALCARCTAFWLGLAGGIVLMYSRTGKIPFWAGFPLLLPLIADGMLQFHSSYESSNVIRLVTGLAGGFGISVTILGRVHRVN